MADLDALDTLFVAAAFLFESFLIIHFALRRWLYATALRFGPVVYALGILAAVVSIILLAGGKPWSFWLAGFLYLAWGAFGWTVEYVRINTSWRNPFQPAVGVPFIPLYLATSMFYWFPLALLWKPLWYLFGLLFLISTWLNVTSHKPAPAAGRS